MDGSIKPYFIRENNLKAISHLVEFVDAIFPVYRGKSCGSQKTPSLISTEDLMKWSNEKSIAMGMGDTYYPNCVLFTMDGFERHLYLYYFNGLTPSLEIQMNFKPRSFDPMQGNNLLHKKIGCNAVRRHKGFNFCFSCQDQWKPIPTRKLYPNWKLYPLLNHILSVFHFSCLLDYSLAVYYKTVGFQSRHVDKMIISYKN